MLCRHESQYILCYLRESQGIQYRIKWKLSKFNVIEWNPSELYVVLNGIPPNYMLLNAVASKSLLLCS